MRESTSIRVSPATRDALREMAERDGITQDEQLGRLLKAERQRRMGLALAADPSIEDEAWIEAGLDTVQENAGG